MDMPEVGRQQRHARADVGVVAIPAEQRAHREAVSEIVRPGPAFRRARLESGTTHEIQPAEVRVAVEQSSASG
jgi:hypothetical protein